MPLPILNVPPPSPTDEMLVRYFHQTERHWTEHIAEASELDVGLAFTNAELGNVHDANRILMASLPAEVEPDDAIKMADEHYAARGVRCRSWVMNPSSPQSQTDPLVGALLSRGYRSAAKDILHLRHVQAPSVAVPELTIIPARASFRHARALAEESAKKWDERQLVEAELAHLDDPHWDALLALKDGVAVATIGVLAAGEIGRIENVFVSASFRRQGIGKAMMARALEICARSLFKHVFVSCEPQNSAAQGMCRNLGFEKIAEFAQYQAPR
jgi:ribosomal protein S18 acetylase RimI-like enzyme